MEKEQIETRASIDNLLSYLFIFERERYNVLSRVLLRASREYIEKHGNRNVFVESLYVGCAAALEYIELNYLDLWGSLQRGEFTPEISDSTKPF